ncbi:MAG TPA: hypothetical protein VFQ68_29705 [Streptosporangiaceae bacterium]|nr:hypothetical protein [Streptosporangiaceae bacterium]
MPATAAAAPAQAPEPPEAAPAKPKHKIGQLTTGELAWERSRLEAALRRPFSADVKALLQARLGAVLAEQDGRERRREADTAAAKAELAAKAAEQAARAARG